MLVATCADPCWCIAVAAIPVDSHSGPMCTHMAEDKGEVLLWEPHFCFESLSGCAGGQLRPKNEKRMCWDIQEKYLSNYQLAYKMQVQRFATHEGGYLCLLQAPEMGWKGWKLVGHNVDDRGTH